MTLDEQPNRQRTVADYLAILRRRKWAWILPLVIVPISAYIVAAREPVRYSASAEVLLTRQDLGSALSGRTNADVFTDADRFAETQAVLARVPQVARDAIERADSQVTPGELLADSTVTPRGNSDLLQFSVETGDPQSAARLATAYARAFTDYRHSLDTAALANARNDLEQTISTLRQQDSTDTPLYRQLTQRAQELRTLELLQARAEVVAVPNRGTQVAPTPRRDATLALALGLLVGLAAVALWEASDRRVRDEDEITATLGLPLLARLPRPRGRRLVMLDDPSDAQAEAVRRLRSNVEFANLDAAAKVIMVTSSVSGEGKTTTISNLGIALALDGYQVALVDLDLRRPMIGQLFGAALGAGLADVTLGRVSLNQALLAVSLDGSSEQHQGRKRARRLRHQSPLGGRFTPGVDAWTGEPEGGRLLVLPAGVSAANPGELVGTRAVAEILSQLRERMDFVLVDAPPVLTVSDAATLSQRVDAILVVTRLGIVDRQMLRDLKRELEASPARKLGVVLTDAPGAGLYGYGASAYHQSSADKRPEPVAAEPRLSGSEGAEVVRPPRFRGSQRGA